MRAGSASGRTGKVGSLGAGPNCHLSGRHIHNRSRDKKRRYTSRSPFQQLLVLPLDYLETADTAPDINSDTIGVRGIGLDT